MALAGAGKVPRSVRRRIPRFLRLRQIDSFRVLAVCTANLCRSPIAAALLTRRLDERGIRAEVRSAGTSARGGTPAPGDVVAVMHEYGIDLSQHRSHPLTADAVNEAHLVIALSRDHLREVILLDARLLQCAFTLKELVRRAAAAGTRPRHVELGEWLAVLASDRDARHLLGASRDDDVADPIGAPRAAIRRTATAIDKLVGRVVDSLWNP